MSGTPEVRVTVSAGPRKPAPAGSIVLGVDGDRDVNVPLATLNRHGLIAGATGTGKTRTLQLLTEQLSAAGVPVVLADVKGDLSGLAQPGERSERVTRRAEATGDDWQPEACPVEILSLGGVGPGAAVRATVDSFGPTLLARMLGLNPTQESCLALVFHYARSTAHRLDTLDDLRKIVLGLLTPAGKRELMRLGGLSAASCAVILRKIVGLSDAGGDVFFGSPQFDIDDLIRFDPATGRGVVSLVDVSALGDRPLVFSTFLMWLAAQLLRDMPEVGDVPQPELVLIIDEAHLVFAGASPLLVDTVVRTVKLIRSKGVSVIFASQSPTDVPAPVLAQLGLRVQHALRAFTPQDAQALRKVATTWPTSDRFDIPTELRGMGTGVALVTVLDEDGVPTSPSRVTVRAPRSLPGKADDGVRAMLAAGSLTSKYARPEPAEDEPVVVARVDVPEREWKPPARPVTPLGQLLASADYRARMAATRARLAELTTPKPEDVALDGWRAARRWEMHPAGSR